MPSWPHVLLSPLERWTVGQTRNRLLVLQCAAFAVFLMKVTQADHACVALTGCSISKEQEGQLVAYFRQVVIVLDADEAGRNAATELPTRLAHKLWSRIVDLAEGTRPDQLAVEELPALLAGV